MKHNIGLEKASISGEIWKRRLPTAHALTLVCVAFMYADKYTYMLWHEFVSRFKTQNMTWCTQWLLPRVVKNFLHFYVLLHIYGMNDWLRNLRLAVLECRVCLTGDSLKTWNHRWLILFPLRRKIHSYSLTQIVENFWHPVLIEREQRKVNLS